MKKEWVKVPRRQPPARKPVVRVCVVCGAPASHGANAYPTHGIEGVWYCAHHWALSAPGVAFALALQADACHGADEEGEAAA